MIKLAIALTTAVLQRLGRLQPDFSRPPPPPSYLRRDLGLREPRDDSCHRAMGTFTVSDRCLW